DYFQKQRKQKVLVEFSSPNIAKTFHVGHYRSTVIGNFISNIFEGAGHEVHRINYIGDWGMQVALIALGFKKYGSYELLHSNPLSHLLDVYVKISAECDENPDMVTQGNKIFSDMENGSQEVIQFWKIIRNVSLKEYQKLYDEINVRFTEYTGESRYHIKAKELIKTLQNSSRLQKNLKGNFYIELAGSDWIEDVPEIKHKATLVRGDGTTVYLARDVTAAIDRYEIYNFDRLIYVTDESQKFHFQQLFAVLDTLGYAWAKKSETGLQHKTFGRISNMSTRKGEMIFFTDVLEEAMHHINLDRLQHTTRKQTEDTSDTAKVLALSGLICHDFKARLSKGYKFSWTAALSWKGNTGLFLQYTHCRLCSLERNCGVTINPSTDTTELVLQKYEDVVCMIDHLACYSDALETSYSQLEPSFLLKYMFELCHLTAKALRGCNIKNSPQMEGEALLLSFHCTKITLANAMKLLGISPLGKD
uniref:Probable arginine--tRNA ligase, mitochondrial n=1 Tax=Ciona savignyi TaxID=51511 RepID=H2ZA95_CIOSA